MRRKKRARPGTRSDARERIIPEIKRKTTQEEFGRIVGLSQQEISKLYRYNVLAPDGDFGTWTLQYFAFLRGQIFTRRGWTGLADV